MDSNRTLYYPITDKNFDPSSQNHFAIRIMTAYPYKDVPKCLTLIRQGKIKEAIFNAGLNTQWTSLPGGSECRLKDGIDGFLKKYQQILGENQ